MNIIGDNMKPLKNFLWVSITSSTQGTYEKKINIVHKNYCIKYCAPKIKFMFNSQSILWLVIFFLEG